MPYKSTRRIMTAFADSSAASRSAWSTWDISASSTTCMPPCISRPFLKGRSVDICLPNSEKFTLGMPNGIEKSFPATFIFSYLSEGAAIMREILNVTTIIKKSRKTLFFIVKFLVCLDQQNLPHSQ